MAVHYRTKGFVLEKTDKGESDQVFVIYTEDFGKLEILGKAIRKIKSKLKSGIGLFYLSEIEFIQGKIYKTLTDALLMEKFKIIKSDSERLKTANRVAEVLNNLTGKQEKDEEIFHLLSETFDKLNNPELPASVFHLIYNYFLWNLLSVLGYKIDLYHCSVCQKKILPRELYFNPDEGGIVCLNCFDKKGSRISSDIIKILRFILKKDWNTLLKLKIEDSHMKQLDSVSENYFSYYKLNKQ